MMLAYRSAIHDTTGFSPARLNFGRELKLPVDLIYGRVPKDTLHRTYHDFVDDLKVNLEETHERAREKVIPVNENQKRRYDSKAMQNQYSPGQHVWIASKTRKKGRCPKLQVHWNGP
jgi:hypothetical protein